MTTKTHSNAIIAMTQLSERDANAFDLAFKSDQISQIVADLDLINLKKPRFMGHIAKVNSHSWELRGKIGATIEQPCSVTLAPVKTRIDQDVLRTFSNQILNDFSDEMEMPDDTSIEPLKDIIDLLAVFSESLSLALPDYPRADGVEYEIGTARPKGTEAIEDKDLNPFAVLEKLKPNLPEN